MSGIVRLAAGIEAELARRLPRQRKTQRGKLALLVATMLSERSANLMDLAAAVPRSAERVDMRYQWIARLLANPRLDCDAVMRPFAEEAIRHASAGGTAVLLLDQSKVSARHQMLVLSVRVGGRALPLAWRVRETRGAIGFAEQRELIARVAAWLPAGGGVVLMGDRFYGTPDLIALCRAGPGLAAAAEAGFAGLRGRRRDHAGRVLRPRRAHARRHRADREAGRDQCRHGPRAGAPRALDHRPVRGPDRPPRVRLRAQVGHRGHVLRLQVPGLRAGGQPAPAPGPPGAPAPGAGAALGGVHRHVGGRASALAGRKKAPAQRAQKVARGRTSPFRRGLRRIQRLLQLLIPLPPLWGVWQN